MAALLYLRLRPAVAAKEKPKYVFRRLRASVSPPPKSVLDATATAVSPHLPSEYFFCNKASMACSKIIAFPPILRDHRNDGHHSTYIHTPFLRKIALFFVSPQ